MRIKRNTGFTLVELLVVFSIIGLLASIIFATLSSARSKSRDARRLSDMINLRTAIQMYYDANGQTYPPVIDDRGDGWDQSFGGTFMPNLAPKYLSQQMMDPVNSGSYNSYYYFNYTDPGGADPGYCTQPYPKAVFQLYLENQRDMPSLVECGAQDAGARAFGRCLCFYL